MPGYQGDPANFNWFKARLGCSNPIGTLFAIIFLLMGCMCCMTGCEEAIGDGLGKIGIYDLPYRATIIHADADTNYCEFKRDDNLSVTYEVHPANQYVFTQCQQNVGRHVTMQKTVFGIYIVSIQS